LTSAEDYDEDVADYENGKLATNAGSDDECEEIEEEVAVLIDGRCRQRVNQ
jgi:hypothetical protein